MIEGVNGTNSAVSIDVGNGAEPEQNRGGNSVVPLLAGPACVSSAIFVWGMPFFYGRNVYAAVEQQSTPGGAGPYIAY
ncbi:hypothetical protein A6V36_27710 [Paraburkholderia ginsengiterrae]|uniref:Uncharacterized protein n=1 Tax=Paraburkholderia ginsengiterrae TaxID=1462993 RepID=A0A1A9NB30_9BURK|nr:hypothetical protein A6V36_27710 [Paraburkholderia ginsengiterrae]OAJ63344.1 hypothetical protein A6V37_20860 [Paraburkholderia ginsengiterrae]